MRHEANPEDTHSPQDRFSLLEERVSEKISDYKRYSFSPQENRALTIFFDLAQEFDNLNDLYSISVIIPKVFYNTGACLYLLNKENFFSLIRCSHKENPPAEILELDREADIEKPFTQGRSFFVPIKGNRLLISQLPITPIGDVIGFFVITPGHNLEVHDKLFFEKFANRIGYQIHNKMIDLKNREHIHFIQNLVTDIGHNVIVPNMYYKILFRQLEGKLSELKHVLERMQEQEKKGHEGVDAEVTVKDLERIYSRMSEHYRIIYSHFEQTSLFLESLLRRSHFEKGEYVLVKRNCNFKSQIIEPQVERFRVRLEEKGIEIDTTMGGVPDEDVWLAVDIGLISPGFANLFSNAVKYTREVKGINGRPRKFMSYGWERLERYKGEDQCAIKLNVFTTGPRISPEERVHLFEPEFRTQSARGEFGTGHGLFFVKEIVELHGGEVGYEATEMGNNFYIILPCEPRQAEDGSSERTGRGAIGRYGF